MKIIFNNIQEYILFLIAINGEIRAASVGQDAPCDRKYFYKQLKLLSDERKIHLHRYPDSKSYYRLSHPAGETELKKLSTELYWHLGLLAGEPGKRYKGAREYRLKERDKYEIYSLMQSLNIPVDGVWLEHRPNDFGKNESGYITQTFGHSVFNQDGSVKSIAEIIKNYDAAEPAFYTSKLLKAAAREFAKHPRVEMSKSLGLLFNKDRYYSAFIIKSPYEGWFPDVENQAVSIYYREIMKAIKDFGKGRPFQNSAIFFMQDADAIYELMTNTTKKIKIKPNIVFNIAYLIPLTESPKDIVKMLLIDGWRDKFNRLLLPSIAGGNVPEDGYTEEGTPIYNLLGCNLGTMNKLVSRIKSRESIVLIHEWMEPIVEKLYGEDVGIIKINNEQLHIFVKAISSQ